MPLPNEAVSPIHLQRIADLPLAVTADESTFPKYAAPSNSEIASAQALEMALNQNDEIPPSRLAALKSKLLAGTLAFVQDIVFLYRLLRHPNTPWYAKAMLFLPVMYLSSPIQLIPNFIPVIGQIDDVCVIWIAKKIAVKLVPANIRQECQDAAAVVKLPRWIRPAAKHKNRC